MLLWDNKTPLLQHLPTFPLLTTLFLSPHASLPRLDRRRGSPIEEAASLLQVNASCGILCLSSLISCWFLLFLVSFICISFPPSISHHPFAFCCYKWFISANTWPFPFWVFGVDKIVAVRVQNLVCLPYPDRDLVGFWSTNDISFIFRDGVELFDLHAFQLWWVCVVIGVSSWWVMVSVGPNGICWLFQLIFISAFCVIVVPNSRYWWVV